jgi:hypothetical protein
VARLLAIVSVLLLASSASAAGPGQYSPPEWLPVRVSSDGVPYQIGCVRTNCTISGAPYHNYWAIDINDHGQKPGAPVFAAGAGQVVAVQSSYSACGPVGTPANYVVIDHGGGVTSQYFHLGTILVTQGQWVDPSTQLGTVGAVGYTFPCPFYHLHFQVTVNGALADFGPLEACHGAAEVRYPQALGFPAWDAVPPYRFEVWSDGSSCSPAPPGPATDVTATPGNDEATVGFTPPPPDGLNAVSGYTVTAAPGGAHATGIASPLTVGGLQNGTTYTFNVTATNAIGTGQPSAPSNAVVPAGPPGAPAHVVAVGKNRRAIVRFSRPSANGAPITAFTIAAVPGSARASAPTSPATIGGLVDGRRYRFRVRATNAAGTGPWSVPSNIVTPRATPAR